jgi:hypothetical protein
MKSVIGVTFLAVLFAQRREDALSVLVASELADVGVRRASGRRVR